MSVRRIALTLSLAVLAGPVAAAEPQKLWEIGDLRQPESVLPASDGFLYVSLVAGSMTEKDGVGFIAKTTVDGRMLEPEWIKGLNAPKGMALVGDKLYVADIDELVEIDVASAKVANRYPAEGAGFLNDVVATPDGRVLVSDTAKNVIFALKDGAITRFAEGPELNGPNGLAIEGDRLIIAGFGPFVDGKPTAKGHLVQLPLAGGTARPLGSGAPIGALDGLVALGGGGYLATDYLKGPLHLIDASGKHEQLLALSPGSADLSYDAASKTAVLPLNHEGKLVAYRLD
ncbi:SMP-30/gluconolactonase/LRE family protein [Methylopila sp. Yamaguchi]|uniref:SMP-30/gluconolactonase/LRE family protein n=1 Tax=Methylopila sp. Yamaguchi TaxID=1437817 RepID=UPI000CC0E953|nr:hypothetical protein [Methylopila sp. Yamaguchi]GBD49139.1 hypothetical protein METY_2352 [Methylopila sp. Yamaguchi]